MTGSTVLVSTWSDGLFVIEGGKVRQELAGRGVRGLAAGRLLSLELGRDLLLDLDQFAALAPGLFVGLLARFAGLQPNSGRRDYSRLRCALEKCRSGQVLPGSSASVLGPSARISAAFLARAACTAERAERRHHRHCHALHRLAAVVVAASEPDGLLLSPPAPFGLRGV
jgi:hypothetical protein